MIGFFTAHQIICLDSLKNQKKLLFLLIMIFILTNLVFSQTSDSPEDKDTNQSSNIITAFSITGLKRTKEHYMQNLLARFKGKTANEETIKQIETMLQIQNLFEEIKVSTEPISSDETNEENENNAVSVNISLKEKISFLPMPFVAFSDSIFMAGLFIMDMNALGIQDSFLLGGLYANNRLLGMATYAKNPHKKGELGFLGSFSVAKNKTTISDGHNHSEIEYESFSLGGGARLLYKPTNSANLSFGVSYNFFNPLEADSIIKMNYITTGIGWNISKPLWNGIFLSANSISLSGELHFTNSEEYKIGESVSAQAKMQLPIAQKIRLLGTASGFFGNNIYYPLYHGRGTAGVSVLPANFRTKEILGLCAGAEFCLKKIKFGLLSAYALYQAAFAQDLDESLYIGHGPESGIRFYLAKIALPAISTGFSYNVTNNSWQYSISLGMGF